MIKIVGLVGLGAVGVLYATQLQAALGEGLGVIADEARIARYRLEGVLANGRPCDFRYVTPNEARPVDLLIFATKYTGLDAAIEVARGACGPETIVISFLNGVSSEGIIDETLHPARLLYATVQGMDATRVENNVCFERRGWASFGERAGGRSAAVDSVAQLFDAAGIAYDVPPDIVHQQWNKWMYNVGLNQSCAYYGVSYAGVQRQGVARAAMLAAMDEARAVAAAEGIDLTEQERDEWVRMTDGLSPEGEPSMRQDVRCGRPTEIELFGGVVCTLGRKHGIATPQNDVFYERFCR